jgi:hypothetical protein
MTEFQVAELSGDEPARREVRVSENRLSGGQRQSCERPAGMSDRTSAPETDAGILLDASERTRCEVWTRVMGYHRPVSAFNAGKRAEHGERRYFVECRAREADRIGRAA